LQPETAGTALAFRRADSLRSASGGAPVPYKSKAEREAASVMTWSQLIDHIRRAGKSCTKAEARRQIGNAIAERELRVCWANERKPPSGSSPIGVPGDEPPRDAQYWQKCKTRRDFVLEPPPYDREMVGKPTAARLDKLRRFRKPMFLSVQVVERWPLVPPPGGPHKTSSDNVVRIDHPRRRGPKPVIGDKTRELMRTDLRNGRFTIQQFQKMTEEALAAEYDASRDTCRKAREVVLSEPEFVDNSPNRNSDN
jgi:hypothetical protein